MSFDAACCSVEMAMGLINPTLKGVQEVLVAHVPGHLGAHTLIVLG